jgi:hypothetical protein
VPDQPRPPAADGGADRGRAAEDPAGERESVAGGGVGGAVGRALKVDIDKALTLRSGKGQP